MTVAEELANRNGCRNKLAGVLVAVDGSRRAQKVRSSHWVKESHLVLILEDGDEVPANRCQLRSKWPVACCPPATENEWNM